LSRIAEKFKELKRRRTRGFIPYITAGDPDIETTESLILEMEKSGADILELGVPFSDPMADGPVIQRASERALRHGIGARDCLELVRRVRKHSDIPIVLFSYLNPLLALGLDQVGSELVHAGIDGVLATDLVPEEAAEFLGTMRDSSIDTVFLASPTSPDKRLRLIAGASSGFLYVLSRTGVTGIREDLSATAGDLVRRVKKFTDLPVAVGFGVSTPEHVRQVCVHADAAVVGSRIVSEIAAANGDSELLSRVGLLARQLAEAAHEPQ